MSKGIDFEFNDEKFPSLSAEYLNNVLDTIKQLGSQLSEAVNTLNTTVQAVNSINLQLSDGVGGYLVQTTAPTNTKMLWINPTDSLTKYYNPTSGQWEYIGSVWY